MHKKDTVLRFSSINSDWKNSDQALRQQNPLVDILERFLLNTNQTFDKDVFRYEIKYTGQGYCNQRQREFFEFQIDVQANPEAKTKLIEFLSTQEFLDSDAKAALAIGNLPQEIFAEEEFADEKNVEFTFYNLEERATGRLMFYAVHKAEARYGVEANVDTGDGYGLSTPHYSVTILAKPEVWEAHKAEFARLAKSSADSNDWLNEKRLTVRLVELRPKPAAPIPRQSGAGVGMRGYRETYGLPIPGEPGYTNTPDWNPHAREFEQNVRGGYMSRNNGDMGIR